MRNTLQTLLRAAGPLGWRRAVLFLALLGCAATVRGQESSTTLPTAPLPTVEQLQSLKDAIDANTQLSDADSTAAMAAYDEAIRLVQQINDFRSAQADLEKRRDTAPETEKQLRADTDKLKAAPPLEIKKDAVLSDVEPLLSTAEADYKAAQAEFDAALAEPNERAQRRRDAPALQEAARKREADALTATKATSPAGETPELTAAKRSAAQARLEQARAELKLIDTELSAYDALNNLVGARQEAAKARLGKIERDLKTLQEAAAGLRREEAAAAARKAAADLMQIPDCDPAVRDQVVQLATDNQALALERLGTDGLAKKIEVVTNESKNLNSELSALREQWNDVKQRVTAGGFSETVGVMLRKQRSDLPNTNKVELAIQQREAIAANIDVLQNQKRQKRLALGDAINAVNDKIATTMTSLSLYEKQRVQSTVKKLVDDQRDLIDALSSDYFRYLTQLEEANRAEKELLKVTNEFNDYISENILWIRGQSPINLHTPAEAREAAEWLFDPAVWIAAPGRVYHDARAHLAAAASEALAVLLLIGLRRVMRLRLVAIGKEARSRREIHFAHTFYALVLSVLISIAWPAALWLLAMRFSSASDGVNQMNSTTIGLFVGVWIWWSFEFIRVIFTGNGLAESHFDWALARERKPLRQALAVAAGISVPAIIVNTALLDYGEDAYCRSLGSITYLTVLITFAFATLRVSTLCKRAIHADDPEHWFVEKTYRGLAARWGLPLLQIALAVMVLVGYYYTALELGIRAHRSVMIIILAATLSSTVRRWLLLARRRIAIDQAKRKRDALRAEAEGEKVEATRDELELDILKIDSQSQAAIRILTVIGSLVSLWFVWTDILPALNVLQKIPLWTTVTQVEVLNGTASTMQDQMQTITAANLGLSLAVLITLFLAVRNLPALIEVLLIQRFNLPAGERYAVLAVMRYAFIGLGITLAFQAIGIGWAKVQWLIAALSVGIGFGMQEIFANFISGLILLIERPVRVGDVVTVSGTSGTVSQIRIRATTITDFDNKDFIVPNKEFITGHLLNWSLPAPSVRIVIPVGVAYGSDLEKTMRILLGAAMNHPKVLNEPAPSAVLKTFGDNALDFELRCFSPDIESAGPVRHELLMKIYKDLTAANIEIAFPQREIHLRGAETLLSALAPKPPEVS